ncbi:MAG: Nudix family hydrolase [Wenzhouxiangella sp.]
MALSRPVIPVVAGVIRDVGGRILLAQRPSGKHLAGCWEFPGGKVDSGESHAQALQRELDEELGLQVESSSPLLSLCHHYPDRSIRLLLRTVERWSGVPDGREGQALGWFSLEQARALTMPEADRPILRLLSADGRYSISPSPGDFDHRDDFLNDWEARLVAGFRLLQLRAHGLSSLSLGALARDCGALAARYQAKWLINGSFDQAVEMGADGVHLSARAAAQVSHRPGGFDGLVAVSCHDADELTQAAALGADFACLSPVQATASHPDVQPMGWAHFEVLCAESPLPVMALGGLGPDDIERARQHGAFGVAGIRGFR